MSQERATVRRRGGDRGAAAVEFAIILFPLCLLLFGIIDWGDMTSVRQSVSQAASEGARAAAVTPGTDDQKKAAAKEAVDAALKAQGQTCTSSCSVSIATCDPTTITPAPDCVTVKVDIDYDPLIPGFDLVLPDDLHYTAEARVS